MAGKIKVDQIETVAGTGTITINNDVAMAATKTLPAASLTGTLPVNIVDSDSYVDGSIDTAHYAAGSVDTTALGADSVTAAKIGDNVLNSEHYAAASIDNEHLADDAVGVAELSATGTASSSTFLRGDNTWAAAGGGKVLQVVQSYVQTRGSGTAGGASFSDVTSQAITLASSSSKVMVSWVISMGSNSTGDNGTPGIRIVRASTAIAVGTTTDSRVPATQGNQNVLNSGQRNSTFSGTFLDSPATAGAVTYKIQGQTRNTGNTWYFGGGESSSNSAEQKMYPTILTLMEIGA